MAQRRIIIAAGGTGGHLIPAQALARQLSADELVFVGAGLTGSRFFDQDRFAHHDIPAATASLSHPWQLLRAAPRLARGFWQAHRFLRRFAPQLVVGFGSYHSLPVLAAAQSLEIPILLHEGNAVPGRVVRHFSKGAKLTGVAFGSAASRLKGNVAQVATPLRAQYDDLILSQAEARQRVGLDPELPTLLILGGSQGAVALNQIAVDALAQWHSSWQVIHLTGVNDPCEPIRRHYNRQGRSHHVVAYTSEMAPLWRAADVALMRAGASSIAEQIKMQVPSILVPYPFAKDRHQDHNADWVEEMGGGIRMDQETLSPTRLVHYLHGLNEQKLKTMRSCLQAIAKQQRSLVSCVEEVLG